MTTALLMKLKVKVMEWPNMSPDLNPIEHMWGILKRKVEKHHVSNIQQLRDVIMEEWKRMPATSCAALVNSMPRRIKAVLDNNGATELRKSVFCGTTAVPPQSSIPDALDCHTWQELLDATAKEIQVNPTSASFPDADDYRRTGILILKRVQQ